MESKYKIILESFVKYIKSKDKHYQAGLLNNLETIKMTILTAEELKNENTEGDK